MAKEYKQLACRDAGMDCEFLVRAETDEEVLEVAGGHAVRVHAYKDISPEMAAQVKSLIKTVQV